MKTFSLSLSLSLNIYGYYTKIFEKITGPLFLFNFKHFSLLKLISLSLSLWFSSFGSHFSISRLLYSFLLNFYWYGLFKVVRNKKKKKKKKYSQNLFNAMPESIKFVLKFLEISNDLSRALHLIQWWVTNATFAETALTDSRMQDSRVQKENTHTHTHRHNV